MIRLFGLFSGTVFMLGVFLAVNVFGAEKIIGYEYIIPKTETSAISDSKLMIGTRTDKEKYEVLARKDISTILDKYSKEAKVYKVIVKETKEVRPHGITATFIRKEGTIPADIDYDSAKEQQKLIDAEKIRLKALQEAELEAQAKINLGIK